MAAEQETNTWGASTVNLEMSRQQYTKATFHTEQVIALLCVTFAEQQIKALGETVHLALLRMKTGVKLMSRRDKISATCIIKRHEGSYLRRQPSLCTSSRIAQQRTNCVR